MVLRAAQWEKTSFWPGDWESNWHSPVRGSDGTRGQPLPCSLWTPGLLGLSTSVAFALGVVGSGQAASAILWFSGTVRNRGESHLSQRKNTQGGGFEPSQRAIWLCPVLLAFPSCYHLSLPGHIPESELCSQKAPSQVRFGQGGLSGAICTVGRGSCRTWATQGLEGKTSGGVTWTRWTCSPCLHRCWKPEPICASSLSCEGPLLSRPPFRSSVRCLFT